MEKIETLCRECGATLFVEVQRTKAAIIVRVELCERCLDEKMEVEDDRGYKHGYKHGHDDGVIDGRRKRKA